ncbi:MAG: phytanoyl-CoA dioxygenase family protein, partial [Phycisphaeraceae bacterium]|nr:phytanoyl-CoA dioxygenase family protein [Phycisphaeraceae bacterium]
FAHRIDTARLADREMVSMPSEAGDGILFHDRRVHSSHRNVSAEDRFALISTYRDGALADDSTVWETARPLSALSG